MGCHPKGEKCLSPFASFALIVHIQSMAGIMYNDVRAFYRVCIVPFICVRHVVILPTC